MQGNACPRRDEPGRLRGVRGPELFTRQTGCRLRTTCRPPCRHAAPRRSEKSPPDRRAFRTTFRAVAAAGSHPGWQLSKCRHDSDPTGILDQAHGRESILPAFATRPPRTSTRRTGPSDPASSPSGSARPTGSSWSSIRYEDGSGFQRHFRFGRPVPASFRP